MRFSPVWYPQLMAPTQALLDKAEPLLQGADFVSNLLYLLIACFNLYGVKCLIHMDSCHASVYRIGSPNPLCDIRKSAHQPAERF